MIRLFNASVACRINIEHIHSIISVDNKNLEEIKRNKKTTCIDLSSDGEIRSAIITQNNFVYFFSFKVETLYNKFEKIMHSTET
ncbi:MAG: DUF370 domain-containing protein [Bacteroidales bacterium]|nr:DUF370 domain-containing protein [Bacteroidales bacterium]